MKKTIKYYRTRDGCADYKFRFERMSRKSWRVYIESQPSYNGRAEGDHATHRISTFWKGKYICWTTPLRSFEEAQQVSALWADKTQDYIRTGRRF